MIRNEDREIASCMETSDSRVASQNSLTRVLFGSVSDISITESHKAAVSCNFLIVFGLNGVGHRTMSEEMWRLKCSDHGAP